MKNGEVYEVQAILNDTIKAAKSGKLIYAVNKNMNFTEQEIQALEQIKQPSEAYQVFDRLRVKLCVDMAVKTDSGAPKTVTTEHGLEFDIENREAFKTALDALREAHKDAVEEYQNAVLQFNKLLDEESDIKIYKIKYSVFDREQSELKPENRLNGEQVRRIWFMLDDDISPVEPDVK